MELKSHDRPWTPRGSCEMAMRSLLARISTYSGLMLARSDPISNGDLIKHQSAKWLRASGTLSPGLPTSNMSASAHAPGAVTLAQALLMVRSLNIEEYDEPMSCPDRHALPTCAGGEATV